MRVGDFFEFEIAKQNLLGALAGSRQHPTRRIANEGLAGKGQLGFDADAVAQRRVIPVLESRYAQLGLEQTLRPLVGRPGLGNEHDLGTAERQRAHVLRIVPIVADGNPPTLPTVVS